MTPFDILRNALLAGFGVQEKVREFVDDLVKKGELSESQGAKLVKEWSEKAEKNTDEIGKSLGDIVRKTLEKMNMPTRDDIQKLEEKVNSLALKISKMEETKK